MKWEIPFSAESSSRDPVVIQIPTENDLTDGMFSDTTRIPFFRRVF
jgi:hypothetical protein